MIQSQIFPKWLKCSLNKYQINENDAFRLWDVSGLKVSSLFCRRKLSWFRSRPLRALQSILTPLTLSLSSEPTCDDWGEYKEEVSVLEGEAGWLSCSLFSHPSVYNYTSTQSTGHNLVWYHIPENQDLEQPLPNRSEDLNQFKGLTSFNIRSENGRRLWPVSVSGLRPDQRPGPEPELQTSPQQHEAEWSVEQMISWFMRGQLCSSS